MTYEVCVEVTTPLSRVSGLTVQFSYSTCGALSLWWRPHYLLLMCDISSSFPHCLNWTSCVCVCVCVCIFIGCSTDIISWSKFLFLVPDFFLRLMQWVQKCPYMVLRPCSMLWVLQNFFSFSLSLILVLLYVPSTQSISCSITAAN